MIGHGPSSNSFFEFLLGRGKKSKDPLRQTFDNFNEPLHTAALFPLDRDSEIFNLILN